MRSEGIENEVVDAGLMGAEIEGLQAVLWWCVHRFEDRTS